LRIEAERYLLGRLYQFDCASAIKCLQIAMLALMRWFLRAGLSKTASSGKSLTLELTPLKPFSRIAQAFRLFFIKRKRLITAIQSEHGRLVHADE
jgi:hypothetical protein